jgi:hypothetical protein
MDTVRILIMYLEKELDIQSRLFKGMEGENMFCIWPE